MKRRKQCLHIKLCTQLCVDGHSHLRYDHTCSDKSYFSDSKFMFKLRCILTSDTEYWTFKVVSSIQIFPYQYHFRMSLDPILGDVLNVSCLFHIVADYVCGT